MAIVNALLVQWSGGTMWVEDAGSIAARGRREGFVQLGAATSAEEATRLAQALLAQRLTPTVQMTGMVEPAGGDEPYANFGLGDTVTAPDEIGSPAVLEAREFTVTTDDDGNPIFAVAFGAVHAVEEARLHRWLNRMAHGTLAGTAHSAAPLPLPLPPPTPGKYRTLPPFSWNGTPAAPCDSHEIRPQTAVRLQGADVVITGNDSGSEGVFGILNINYADGTVLGTITPFFPVGSKGGMVFNAGPGYSNLIDGPAGDTLSLHLYTTGVATGITVTPIVG